MKILRAVMLAAVCATTTTAATSASLRDVEHSTTVSIVGGTTVPEPTSPETILPETSVSDPTTTIGG